jgi:hypothetical protein
LKPIVGSVPLLSGWWWDGGFKTPLLQRVVMLLHSPFPMETRASRWWSAMASLVVLAMAILASSLSLFADPSVTFGSLSRSSRETPGVFQVSRFVAAPRVLNPAGQSAAYVLPLPLPPRFELSVEIEASRSTLSRMWLAGYSLAAASPGSTKTDQSTPADRGAGDDPSTWHRVFLRREGASVTLFVDGQNIPVASSPEGSSDWLTIEPSPDQSATLRNLTVMW